MDALPASQPTVDLLHHQGEERRCHPAESDQDGVEGVVGVPLVGIVGGGRLGPEPVPAPPDVPVVKGVDEGLDLMGGTRQVVGLHVVLNRLDQQAGLGQQIAVQ